MKVKERMKVVYMLGDSGMAKLAMLFNQSTMDFIDAMMNVEQAMERGDMPVADNGYQRVVFGVGDFEEVLIPY